MLSRLIERGGSEIGTLVWPVFDSAPEVAASPAEGKNDSNALELELRRAYEAGVQEGEASARRQSEHASQQVASRLADTIAALASTRKDLAARAEADVVRLAIDIAERVLHREVSVDTDALSALVRAALEKLGSNDVYKVRVDVALAPLVRRCLEERLATAQIEIIAEASLPEGSILFESVHGTLDASIDTQLREIERGLADRMAARS
jgi:flagellar assembly protein FliH